MALFDCNYCPRNELIDAGAVSSIDIKSKPTECVICHRSDCHECINEERVCVPCE